jgi:glycosyltransferase involved in cell wall biosynthesis
LSDRTAFQKVLPSKLFEYAATGKPILAGVSGYAREFIAMHIVGCEIFDPEDSEMMVRKLEVLIAGPRFFDRSQFKEEFSRERIMTEFAKTIIVSTGAD